MSRRWGCQNDERRGYGVDAGPAVPVPVAPAKAAPGHIELEGIGPHQGLAFSCSGTGYEMTRQRLVAEIGPRPMQLGDRVWSALDGVFWREIHQRSAEGQALRVGSRLFATTRGPSRRWISCAWPWLRSTP